MCNKNVGQPLMDRTFTDIQHTDENATKSAPHLVEISIVPPEHPATDGSMPPQSRPRATEPGAGNKTEPDPALDVGLLSRQTTAAVNSAFNCWRTPSETKIHRRWKIWSAKHSNPG